MGISALNVLNNLNIAQKGPFTLAQKAKTISIIIIKVNIIKNNSTNLTSFIANVTSVPIILSNFIILFYLIVLFFNLLHSLMSSINIINLN